VRLIGGGPAWTARPGAGRADYRKALLLALAFITLVGAALRWYRLERADLWLDEALTVFMVSQPLGPMLREIATEDVHPALYFLLVRVPTTIWPTELGLRLVPFLFGVLSIPLAAAVATDLVDRRAGLAAAGFVAVSAPLVAFSQDGRMYAQLAAFELMAAWSLIRGLRDGDRRWFLGFSLCSALALYTHNVGGLFFAAHVAAGLLQAGRRVAVVLASGLTLALYLPWLPTVVAQTQRFDGVGGWYGPSPPWWLPLVTLVNLLAGTELRDGIPSARFAFDHLYLLSGAVALLAVGWKRLAPRPEARRVLLATLLGPIVLEMLLSLASRVYMDKTLLAGALVLSVVMAASFGTRERTQPASLNGPLLAAALVVVLQLWAVTANWATPRESYRDLVAHLALHAQPGDTLHAAPWFLGRPLRYYLARTDAPIEAYEVRAASPEDIPEGTDRLWVVSGPWEDYPEAIAARRWRERFHYASVWQGGFPDDGLRLTLYTRTRA
jgi:uncharacterized membrane protein